MKMINLGRRIFAGTVGDVIGWKGSDKGATGRNQRSRPSLELPCLGEDRRAVERNIQLKNHVFFFHEGCVISCWLIL